MQIAIHNLAEETTPHLKALAHFINCVIADREGTAGNVPPLPTTAAPVAPGVSAASTPPAAPAQDDEGTSNPDAPNVDKNGLAWDERIHASSKAVNQDGTWRYKRGVDKALIDQVEAELRGAPAAPAPEAPPAPPAPPAAPAAHDVPPPPPPAEAAPVAPPAPAVNSGVLFKRINDLKKAGKLDDETVKVALDTVGLASMAELLKSKDAALFEQLAETVSQLAGEA